ncbi:MAG: hypothetical protein RJB58_301 [Pseudomonadota bacterium]|jgi:hypothetical protein
MTLRALLLSSAVLLGGTPVFAQELDSTTTIVMDLNDKDIEVADGLTIGDLSGGVGSSAADEGGPIVMQFVQQPTSGASTGTAAGSRYVAPVARR